MSSTIEQCGKLLLGVYSAAIISDSAQFQEEVLNGLGHVVGFERAWWGMMRPTPGGFELLSSYRADLPESFEAKWQSITHDDRLAVSANEQPARTVRFDTRALHTTRGLYELNADHDIRNALCTSIRVDSTSDAFFFISLFRCGRSAGFSDSDVRAKQFVMPHVYSAWRHNLQQRFRTVGPYSAPPPTGAFIDLQSAIVDAHPGFVRLLEGRWPHWTGPRLPSELQAALQRAAPDRPFRLGLLRFTVHRLGGLALLNVHEATADEHLTVRERDVAIGFADGNSYKELARQLQMAPATVRHHLRVIYTKLGITNKAQLTRLMARSAPLG